MNKSELIDIVAAKADISKSTAGDALDAVLDGITGALKNCLLYTSDAADE